MQYGKFTQWKILGSCGLGWLFKFAVQVSCSSLLFKSALQVSSSSQLFKSIAVRLDLDIDAYRSGDGLFHLFELHMVDGEA